MLDKVGAEAVFYIFGVGEKRNESYHYHNVKSPLKKMIQER